MDWTMILAAAGGAVALVGAGGISWQIYHMTVIDVKARGFKHPKFWGMFTMSGNCVSGCRACGFDSGCDEYVGSQKPRYVGLARYLRK